MKFGPATAAALVLCSALSDAALALSTECRQYSDTTKSESGENTFVWLHPKSFADRAVCPGGDKCEPTKILKSGLSNDPSDAVGPPDYNTGKSTKGERDVFTLGCGGSLTVEFTDNRIIDVPGPDIFVFEIGKAKEGTRVEISNDANDANAWILVDQIGGGKASVDISRVSGPNQSYRFIRLTDLATSCLPPYAGAEIDAVATFGYSWARVQDEASAVLFETGKHKLRPKVESALRSIAEDLNSLPGYRLTITGHTDSVGSSEANQALSEKRAGSVSEFLTKIIDRGSPQPTTFGKGEDDPVATNETASGRAKNRRVELLYVPQAPCAQPDSAVNSD